MSDMREVLAETIMGDRAVDNCGNPLPCDYELADAIIAALPSMVKPLVWYDTTLGQTSQGRLHWYKVYENSRGTYTLDDGEAVQECSSVSDAYIAAQKHYIAMLLEPFGLVQSEQ